MFERFTQQARGVVTNAVDIAGRRKDGYVRPDHLLLAIASTPEGSQAATVLKRMGATRDALAVAIAPETKDAALLATLGINLDEVRRRVEYSFGEGAWARRSARPGHIPFTPDAKKALELSLRHALALRSKSIDDRHILLGVLDSGRDVKDALSALGLQPSQVKRSMLDAMKQAS